MVADRSPASAWRQLSYWVLGLVLLIIGLYAIQRTLQLRRELADEKAQEAEQALAASLRYWEEGTFRQLEAWMDELGTASDIASVERRIRRQAPWFDSVYVWTTNGEGRHMRYPLRSPVEDERRLMRHPCLARANRYAPYAPPDVVVAAWRACRDAPPPQRLFASSLAAGLLLQQGMPQEALASLHEVGSPPLTMPLHEAVSQGISPIRLAFRRTQAAQAYGALGQKDTQARLLLQIAREIAELDAPQLEEMLPFLQYSLPSLLEQAGHTGGLQGMQAEFLRAGRRLAAYQAVMQRLMPLSPRGMGEGLEIASDPYGESGFLLVYGPIHGGQQVAAIQLDPRRLLQDLPPASPHRRVTLDAQGTPLPGEPTFQPEDLWLQVPFGRLFPHLRAGLLRPPSDDRAEQRLWLLSQLAPIALALVLGILAIAARVRADRRQQELYDRQQDFIARVTHELKTPLAGIQLMAETLELGAAPAKRGEFIARILQESERLEQRIDEVLRIARQPTPPQTAQISPRALAEEVAEEWEERFAAEDAILEADLAAVPDVQADEALLRDALNNLLSNALKYRREDRAGYCLLKLYREGRFTVFEVIDNGLGVPPAQRTMIFERFARVEVPGRGKAGGHGLGLSFVAETAAAHGGSAVCLEGIEGGSRFVLRIRG